MKGYFSIGGIIVALCATLMLTTSASAQEVRRLSRDTTAAAPALQQSQKKTLQNKNPRQTPDATTTTPIMQRLEQGALQDRTLKKAQDISPRTPIMQRLEQGALQNRTLKKTPDASPATGTIKKSLRIQPTKYFDTFREKTQEIGKKSPESTPTTTAVCDLTLTGLGLSDDTVAEDEQVTIAIAVQNVGMDPCVDRNILYILSPDNQFDENDFAVGLDQVTVNPGATVQEDATFIPADFDVPPDDYFLIIGIVEEGEIFLTTEAVLTITPVAGGGACDLTISSFTVSMDPVSEGESVTITVNTENIGTAPCVNRRIEYYLSLDDNITPADFFLGDDSVTLDAGQTGQESITFTPENAGVPPGTYFFGVIIPEENNVLFSSEPALTITPGGECDLAIPSFTVSMDPVSEAEEVTITANVENRGTAPCVNRRIEYYLSLDDNITPADFFLGDDSVTLDAGQTGQESITFRPMDVGVPPGTYFSGQIIPDENEVWFSSEPALTITGVCDLAIPSFTVSMDPVSETEEVTITANVENRGTAPCVNRRIEYYLSLDDNITPADFFLGDDSVTLDARQTGQESITFRPMDVGVPPGTYFSGQIIPDENEVWFSTNPALTVVGVPPVIAHTAVSSPVDANQELGISATITDNTGLSTANMYYQAGGSTSFSTTTLSEMGNTYEGTVPADDVSSRGIRYFIDAVDIDGLSTRTDTFSVQVRESAGLNRSVQAAGEEVSAYRLISVPLDLAAKSPGNVLEDDLGSYDPENWRLFGLNASQGYDEFPSGAAGSMSPGRAFFLIVKEAGQQWNTGLGTSIPLDRAFPLSLNSGWNFIATPFNFEIARTALQLASGGEIDLMTYNGSWRTHTGPLRPFEGYALSVASSGQLLIDPNDRLATASKKQNAEPVVAASFFEWSIQVLAQAGHARDEENFAAVAAEATSDWDIWDRAEPPVIGKYVSVYFPHPEWQVPFAGFRTDVRPVPNERESWTFEVKSNVDAPVTLRFEGIDEVPRDFEVWLVDEVAQVWQDLRERATYTVAGAGGQHARAFRLLVGRPDALAEEATQEIPESFVLENFPNPFNPQTTIRYGLTSQERVTVAIYNVLGEYVATLVENEEKSAGYHTVAWDGRNQAGHPVASGVYIYTFQTEHRRTSQKMVLMK